MSALFISDLHLCEQVPENTHALLTLLDGPARGVETLYILGDLFEYWAGDDDDTALNHCVRDALSALCATGVRVAFVPGNRDFLLGHAFARAAGMQILADPAIVDLDGHRALVSHGDMLCTDDLAYQTYRCQVRDPAWQAAFLQRPLAERKQLVEALRRQSEIAKQGKATQIMDANLGAIQELLREHSYPILIHGHTHRPAHHIHDLDGRRCERWVLSDWRGAASWLLWDGTDFSAHP